jgi:opacity protein-like surface antigen
MKRLAVLVLVLLFLTSVSVAGDPKPVTHAGAKALLFDLGGLADLAAGNYGGGLGAKYYIGPDLALRLSLGFTTATTTTKNPVSPLPVNQVGESKLTGTEFTMTPAITYNVAKTSTVVAYVGAMFAYTSASDKREGNAGGLGVGYASGASYRQSSTTLGFGALLGVEWFPWENISFSAEYRLGYAHTSSETESATTATSVTTDGPTTSGFGLGSANSGALTLSLYF